MVQFNKSVTEIMAHAQEQALFTIIYIKRKFLEEARHTIVQLQFEILQRWGINPHIALIITLLVVCTPIAANFNMARLLYNLQHKPMW